MTSAKVPTELSFDEGGVKWGFQIPENQSRYQCFKLELEPKIAKDSSHLGMAYPDPKALSTNDRNNGESLCSAYLTCMRKHILEMLKRGLSAAVINTTPIEFILTVPAIWSESAKQNTGSCAERAGLNSSSRMIAEPEAAIMYCLKQESDNLDVGDIVVVCDAGGGTVDLISYMIEQFEPVLQICEATAGTGHACGSNFLNRMFRQTLQDKFRNLPDWEEDTLQEALDYFERTVKRKFNGRDDPWLIPVPGLPDMEKVGIRRGKWKMPGKELRSLFQPVMATITSLVQMQIKYSKAKGNVKTVHLVGGFGESVYLRESIKEVVPTKIQVIQPPNAWTAVVRWALLKGLAEIAPLAAGVTVKSRIARKAYGLCTGVEFKSSQHEASRKCVSCMNESLAELTL